MNELNGKNVLITGANRGIGLALAERFLAEGATCILTTRDAFKRDSLVKALGNPQRATTEIADIADEASVRALRDRVGDRFPRIDVLINNAAIFIPGDRETRADTLDPRIMRETLEVNLFGSMAMCAAFAPLIPAGGRIINVGSTMGQLSDGITPYATAYSVSKTALNAYSSSLAAALHDRKIMVDTFHPGWVKTEMGGPNAQIEPHEATQTAIFLATRAPSDVTGRFWFESKPIAW